VTGDLVYLPTQRGEYEPQKWPHDVVGTLRTPVRRHRLSEDEYALPIGELVRKYPPPKAEPADAI
jgi:hypothetical protein